MARKFVSPSVTLTEIDRSFLPQGAGDIGAAVIGRSLKGPAFAPTIVGDFNEFAATFGDVDPTMVAPYAAKNYLKNSATMTFVRVLGSRDGKSGITNGAQFTVLAVTASGGEILAEIAVASGTTFVWNASTTPSFSFSGTSGAFAGQTFLGTCSFNTTSASYIANVLNDDPTKVGSYGHFLWKCFQWAGSGSGGPFATASLSGGTTASFDYDFTLPATPMVRSQWFGAQRYDLFQFYQLAAGNSGNFDIKVSIANIRASQVPAITPFGTFDVIVRAFSDTDNRPVVVENFSNLSLDPSSSNYLPRVIGDQYFVWNSTTRKNVVNGTFANRSKHIRVSMAAASPPASALPWGHAGYPENRTSSANSLKDIPFVITQLDSQNNPQAGTFWGLDFTQAGVGDRLKFSLAASSVSLLPALNGTALDLSVVTTASLSGVSYLSYTLGASNGANVPTSAAFNGFSLAFYGGFDGFDPSQADPLAAVGPNNSVATISLKLAIDAVSNPDEIDMNVLCIPGITDPNVNSYARSTCNDRADALCLMDIVNAASTGSVAAAISALATQGIDDNYAATYYPCLRYSDTTNNVVLTVPPSVAVLGALAYSDRVGQVFFAPAGLTRGGLAQFGIIDTVDRLTFQDRNDLYDARINPIATFPNEGIVVFGQKTLQARPSALDRVNVRRLLIFAKKTIASVAKLLIFEPNNPSTWQRFINTVNPILDKIRQDQGLERFKVVMDSTVNTPDLIDRNIMTGKIFLQPTRAAEFIDLSFIITATGVAFEE